MGDIVILRRWRKNNGGGVIALFPEMEEGNGRVNSYEHIGQHGEASYWHVVNQTEPVRSVDEPGVADLLSELTRIGYEPVVRRRRSRQSR